MRTHDLIQTALCVALCVALGYLLAAVPNVELISAGIFTSGVWLGVRRGALVGVAAELLYSGLNPYGFAPPPLLAAQVLGMSGIGAAGGVFAAPTTRWPWRAQALLAGLCGLVATLVFDVLTNSAGYLMVREATPFGAYLLAGLSFPFPLAHALINAVGFAVVVPGVRRALRRWSPA